MIVQSPARIVVDGGVIGISAEGSREGPNGTPPSTLECHFRLTSALSGTAIP
jgi:hypothetical protein